MKWKNKKCTWHLSNVPFIWFYYYSFCHRLNFILWLCCVAVREGFFFLLLCFCPIDVIFFFFYAPSFAHFSFILLSSNRSKTYFQTNSLLLRHTWGLHLKFAINRPKSALFTAGTTIIACILLSRKGKTWNGCLSPRQSAWESLGRKGRRILLEPRELMGGCVFENLTLAVAISQLTQSLSFRPCWSEMGVWSLIRG